MNFNPNEPCTVGCEWFPALKGISVLDSKTKAIGMRLKADTADEIANLWIFLREAFGGYSAIVVEVFDITAGLPVLAPTQIASYFPTTDVYTAPSPWTPGAWGSFNGWIPELGALGPNWAALDSPTLTPFTWTISGQYVDNDEFIFNFFGLGFDFAVGFGGVAGTQAGRWITGVTAWANCAQYLALGAAGAFQIQPYLMSDGDKRLGPAQVVDASQGALEIAYTWNFNPITAAPWTATDIDRFDGTYAGPNKLSIGWIVQPTGSSNNLATILQGQLRVESAPTDPRLAIGSTILPPSATIGWRQVTMRDPGDWSTPSTFTLVPGNDYLFIVRPGGGIDPLAPAFLRSEEEEGFLPGPPFWSAHAPTLDLGTLRPTALNDQLRSAYACILGKADTTMSLDSQPYMTSSSLGGKIDAFPSLNRFYDDSVVHSTRSIQQEFTPTASDNYAWLFVFCAQIGNTVDADLVVTIRRRSDDVQMGLPFTIVSDDLPEPRNFWRRVGVRMPAGAAALVAGTQYYFDITSTATASQGWLVQVLNDGNEGATTGIAPPAGTADIAYGEGVDELDTGDPLVTKPGWAACITISTTPDPVENFIAANAGQTCGVDHIILTWTTTAIVECGGFGAYEIQRRDDPTLPWRRIAYITDEQVGVATDYESIRNKAAEYRIRVVRADRSPSDWSATATATAAMVGVCGLIFTSNADPTLTVFYEDIPGSQTRTFSFPRNFGAFQPQGANYQVVYWEIPDRGVTFQTKVRLRSGRQPCLPACEIPPSGYGMSVFDPLKDITRAGLPYVTIHDETGNRWFGFVNTPKGDWSQHGIEREGGFGAYTMDIVVVEVTDVPEPFDAEMEPGS